MIGLPGQHRTAVNCNPRTVRPWPMEPGVVGPDAALVAGEDPGVHEDLEMVGDGRLGQAERFGQLTDASLAAFVRGD